MIINSYMSTVAQIENNNIFYKQFPPLGERDLIYLLDGEET